MKNEEGLVDFISNRRITLEIDIFAVEIEFHSCADDFVDYVDNLWCHMASHSSEREGMIYLQVGGNSHCDIQLSQTTPPREWPAIAYKLSQLITRTIIAELAGRRILIHAAAIAHEDGAVTALVGASGMGKSTAAAELTKSLTVTYVTDETLIWDPINNSVSPYRKPLSRIRDDVKGDYPPPDLRSGFGAGLHARSVIFLERSSAATNSISRLTFLAALRYLVPQTSSIWLIPGVLTVLHQAYIKDGGFFLAEYDEISRISSSICESELPRRKSRDDFSRIYRPAAWFDPAEQAALKGDTLYVTPFADAAVTNGTLVIIRDSEMVEIEGFGAHIWPLIVKFGPLTNSALERRCMRHFDHLEKSLYWNSIEKLISAGLISSS